MSFAELWHHPERLELMSIARTIELGENEGEWLRELNPEFQAQKKEMSERLSKARK